MVHVYWLQDVWRCTGGCGWSCQRLPSCVFCCWYMCGGVLGVCALGCMKVYMLWCRYMCFLFVCQGNNEWVASLAVYGGCHGDMHV